MPEETCVLPAITYSTETWALTKQAHNKLAVTQSKMERGMLNSTYKDRNPNVWVNRDNETTYIMVIIRNVRKMKRSWARHINRLKDDLVSASIIAVQLTARELVGRQTSRNSHHYMTMTSRNCMTSEKE